MKRSGSVERGIGDESVTGAVVAAIAEAKGIQLTEIAAPLYESVDTDALERLFAPTTRGIERGVGRVVFTVADCEVVVHGTDRVVVTPTMTCDPAIRTSGAAE